ncbi:MAG: hypothetical protein M3R44_06235 [Candidatus Eremiobacteraeota bacterium]|nr:hypothetical protein [Candidatus Eremiobacteraeota bacterium]
MSEFDILRSAAAGMDAQRAALDLAARNVAAAEATPVHGAAFERLVPRYAFAPDPPTRSGSGGYEPPAQIGDEGGDLAEADAPSTSPQDPPGAEADVPVRYLGARAENGVDVDAVTEMVAVLEAQRAYESNASIFDVGKRLAERTIDVGRLS